MTTTESASARIQIEMTETITSKYFVTREELEALDLPADAAQLSEYDTDQLFGMLLDEAEADEYAVTERELEISEEDADDSDDSLSDR